MTTTAEENARLASGHFAAVTSDNTFVDGLPSDDYVAHMGCRDAVGLDGVKANMARRHEAFPDRTVSSRT